MAVGRVAYILTEFPSRTEIFAAREISALMAMGWQVSVLAATRSPGVTAAVSPSAVVYRPRLFSWATVGSLGQVLRRYPLAMVRLAGLLLQLLLQCPRETLVLLRNIPALARFIRHLDAEGIGHVHAYFLGWPACLGLAISRVTGRSLTLAGHARDIFVEAGAVRVKVRQARAVVTCTQQGRRHLKRLLPAWLHDRIHLVCHGLDLSSAEASASPRSTGSQNVPCILAIARFVPKKGLENLLSAFGILQGQRPPCRLIVVGDGPGRPRFERIVQDAGLGEHVKILGWLGSADVAAQMSKASVLAVPSVIARLLHNERITFFAGIPTMWAQMFHATHGVGRWTPFPLVRVVTNSGARLTVSLQEKMVQAFPNADIFLMYGLTEAFRSTYLPADQRSKRPESIGRPLLGVELFLVNERGELAGEGECGEIVHRGETVTMGYWQRPEGTARVFRPNPFAITRSGAPEYVVYSGDYGRYDQDGFLYFVGRRDLQMKVQDTRVSPEEIEVVLMGIQGVSECAVMAVGSDELGDRIMAFIVPDGPLDKATVLRCCRARLPQYMIPRQVEFRDSFPRLGNGKIDRMALRKDAGGMTATECGEPRPDCEEGEGDRDIRTV